MGLLIDYFMYGFKLKIGMKLVYVRICSVVTLV